jgi:hypothetical protein
MTITSLVLYLRSWNGCLTLEETVILCVVPQTSHVHGHMTIEAMSITVAL